MCDVTTVVKKAVLFSTEEEEEEEEEEEDAVFFSMPGSSRAGSAMGLLADKPAFNKNAFDLFK